MAIIHLLSIKTKGGGDEGWRKQHDNQCIVFLFISFYMMMNQFKAEPLCVLIAVM